MKRSALGRGLGALISDADALSLGKPSSGEYNLASITDISMDMVESNPFQPRSSFDEESLIELAESIKTLGLIQPITVRVLPTNKYQIISGERRFKAAALSGLTHIPAYIRKADDQEMLEMALVENIQRENLDAIEVAISFQRLIDECNLTQEDMAQRVGKKRATIANYLRLLKLPAEIQLFVRTGKISMGHARALLSVEHPEKQLRLCRAIVENDLTVRDVEKRVSKITDSSSLNKKETEIQELNESYFKLLEFLGKYFNNNISLKRDEKSGKGYITIRFDGDKEVSNFVEAIEKTNL